LEAFPSLRVVEVFFGEDLEGYIAAQAGILGFVDDTRYSRMEVESKG